MAWDWSIQFQNPRRSWEFFFQHNGKWSDVPYIKAFIYFMCVCVCVCLFRAVLMALGGSQATGWTGGVEVGPQPQQCHIWAMSATYNTGHSNARSLSLWGRPVFKPVSTWILVRFVPSEPRQEFQAFISLRSQPSLCSDCSSYQVLLLNECPPPLSPHLQAKTKQPPPYVSSNSDFNPSDASAPPSILHNHKPPPPPPTHSVHPGTTAPTPSSLPPTIVLPPLLPCPKNPNSHSQHAAPSHNNNPFYDHLDKILISNPPWGPKPSFKRGCWSWRKSQGSCAFVFGRLIPNRENV